MISIVDTTPISWHPGLSVFAKEQFLASVSDRFGWIGGFDNAGDCRCILPYTILHRAGIQMARFRVETIPLCDDLSADEESRFLSLCMDFLQSLGADVVIPASTNTIFRTFPTGAESAPYGSYTVDLSRSEEELWRRVHRITRQNINTAKNEGVKVRDGLSNLDKVHALIRATFNRSRLPFMKFSDLDRYVTGLGENVRVLITELDGEMQSCVVYAFSNYCAYAVYGGNLEHQHQGSAKLLHWEAMKMFRQMGIKRYDFVGARIDPPTGSKQHSINSFKSRLGGELRQGFLWKYRLHPIKSLVYSIGVRILRGGDIVDNERSRANRREVIT